MGELFKVFTVGVCGVFIVMAVLYFAILLIAKVSTGIEMRMSNDK